MEWNGPTHSPSPMSLYPHHYHWQYHRQYQYVGNIIRISIDSIANRTRHIITSSFKLWRAEQTIANLKGKTNIGFEKTRSRRWQSHSIFEKETEDCEKRNRKRLDSTRLDSTRRKAQKKRRVGHSLDEYYHPTIGTYVDPLGKAQEVHTKKIMKRRRLGYQPWIVIICIIIVIIIIIMPTDSIPWKLFCLALYV